MQKARRRVTTYTVLNELKIKDIFHGSRMSLVRILHNLGFAWRKENNRSFLMETENIVFRRYNFLKSYIRNKNSENPLPVVFLDETWIFQKGTYVNTWQDGKVESCRSQGEGGQRYIIVHAGNKNGFIEGAGLIFASKKSTGDYHHEMNSDNFIKWLQTQLLPGIKEKSLIILDNATYHSKLTENIPTAANNKSQLQEWLRKRGIYFDEGCLKQDLLQLIQANKPKEEYLVDKIILQAGHYVLKLPPYHCQFNAIEHIWGIAKNYYNKNIGRDGWGKIQALNMWQEAITQITPQMWQDSVRHVEEIIEDWWKREVGIDAGDINPLIINVGAESEDEEDDL